MDFDGAHSSYEAVAADYIVVAANDPDAGSLQPIARQGTNRGYIPLVAGDEMFFNVTHIGAVSEVRVQCSVSG